MQKIHQEMLFCQNCKKATMHQGNVKSINWLMHIALCFVGIGFITLPLAILSRILTANIGGKKGLYCSGCGGLI
jgi:hypothetical protein